MRLRQRGHRVTVVTNEHFAPLVKKAGLEFASIGTDAEYRELAADAELWKGRRAMYAIARGIAPLTERVYLQLARLHEESGRDLIVAASSLALGARVAQEHLALPLATVHLSPAVFQTEHEMPRLPGLPPPRWLPRWVKRGLYRFANFVIDRMMAGPLNAFRGTLGLPPTRNIFSRYWHSPDAVLGMFPEWFGAIQPDWPANVRTVGFPLYDERGVTPLSAELQTFLDAGEPPIAFTPGSAMFQGGQFFGVCAEACRRMKRRGVLLSRYREHIPRDLPPGVIHVDYAPFSLLLPRCAALVHHGGIGTSAQAMLAACPQIIQPFAHDQPDNADRLCRLGVARALSPRWFTARRLARELNTLLGDPRLKERCGEIAQRIETQDGLGKACDLLETLAPSPRNALVPA